MRLLSIDRCRNVRGYTLMELLLSVVLLLMLVGAAVFSFSSLQRDAQLDEGVLRVETLMRLAKAHASNSGRQVQVVFTAELETESTGSTVKVVWEPEPLTKPGEFVELTTATPVADGVNELVVIETPKPAEAVAPETPDTTAVASAPAEEVLSSETVAPPAAISFYPDGSSDPAEIIVASRNTEDSRRVSLQLLGTTGSMHVQWLNGN